MLKLFSIISLLLSFIVVPARAQSELMPCPKDQKIIKDNCFGTLVDRFGTYEGEWKDGEGSGKGTTTYSDGRKHTGMYKHGRRNGQGTTTWSDGRKYVGEYKNDKIDGQGTLTYPDGRVYIGEFKNEKANGQGTETWPSGEKYVGEYKNGSKYGQGTYIWSNGGKYVGQFKDNVRSGEGVLYYPDGLIKEEGFWKADRLVKQAQLTKISIPNSVDRNDKLDTSTKSNLPPCPTGNEAHWDKCFGTYGNGGDKYTGEWRDNKQNGQGVRISRSGQRYIGEFKDDEMSGHGEIIYENGDRYNGEFAHNKRYGRGKYFFHEGKTYEGEYVADNQNGFGVLIWSDGKKYVGEFNNNSATSNGRLEFPDGEVYVGEFNKFDQRHGKGIQYFPDGSIKKFGFWVNDKFLKALPIDQANELSKQETGETIKEQAKQVNEKITTIYLPKPSNRTALIIANSNYSSAPLLHNPINDANLLANSLKAAGFQSVTVKSDQSRESLISSIQQFAKTADGADWAVIYYSGHGIAYNGINYMIPVDAKLKADKDIQLEAVDVNAVVSALEGTKKLRVVILDMCRSNPFVGGMRRSVASRSIGRGLAPIEPEAGVLTVFAAKDGQEALDGEGSNSPFAEALAKRMLSPNLEIRRLFDIVRDDVLAATQKKQMPFSYGSVSGSEDFYFVQK